MDYAKEVARWTYEDLQREINKRLKTSGNTLYKIACGSDVDEPIEHAWIGAYFMKSSKRIGVYFRCSDAQFGREIAQQLQNDRVEIIEELGSDIIWTMDEGGGGAGVRLPCDDIFLPENREQRKEFFAVWTNNFINTFRPRLKRIVEEI